jgi:transposase
VELLHSRCAGLDVHKDSVVACARTSERGKINLEVRTFGTTTGALLELSDWLAMRQVTHVAMEATGVYWRPIWHILEGTFDLVLANAAHVKNVPGRKTDVNDATWLAELLAHGLIRGSFVPPTSVQEVRTLTRTRKQLVREQLQHVYRIQKTLEDANIKLSSVVTDTLGKSSRAMLEAIIAGETDPEKLADLALKRLKRKRDQLREALRGRVTSHHRFLLRLHLDQYDALAVAIARVESEVGSILEPFRLATERLKTIPGVSDVVANVLVGEIGTDMSRFPTPGHLISWAGLCPRSDESAGKRRSTRLRKAGSWLKTTLVQAAWAAVRTRDRYPRAQFLRIKSRRGSKKAVVAVAASLLKAVFYMLRDGTEYRDLGHNYFDRRDKLAIATRMARRIRDLGYEVQLTPA